MSNSKSAQQLLEEAANLYGERNKLYGDNYKRFGGIMQLLHPEGLELQGRKDFNRLGIWVQIISKLTRYAQNIETGHEDSLRDLIVYSAMLLELDLEYNNPGHGNDWLAAALGESAEEPTIPDRNLYDKGRRRLERISKEVDADQAADSVPRDHHKDYGH